MSNEDNPDTGKNDTADAEAAEAKENMTDGPGEPDTAEVDPDRQGPDGTKYDEKATEDAHRRMTGGTDDT